MHRTVLAIQGVGDVRRRVSLEEVVERIQYGPVRLAHALKAAPLHERVAAPAAAVPPGIALGRGHPAPLDHLAGEFAPRAASRTAAVHRVKVDAGLFGRFSRFARFGRLGLFGRAGRFSRFGRFGRAGRFSRFGNHSQHRRLPLGHPGHHGQYVLALRLPIQVIGAATGPPAALLPDIVPPRAVGLGSHEMVVRGNPLDAIALLEDLKRPLSPRRRAPAP